jgi:chromosome segregation ATPase
LKNVLIPLLFATEKERQRNTRLVQALQRLTRQKHTACQTAKQTKKFHSIRMQSLHQAQIQKLKQQWQAKIDAAVEEQQEMEQVLDDMRREMETMLEELDQVKQQKERYQQKAKRLEQDLIQSTTNSDEDAVLQNLLREAETRIDQLQADLEDQIIKTSKLKQSSAKDMETIKSRMSTLHSQQVSALIAEKEELRSRLVKAERSAAELALLFEVEKKKTAVKPHDSELEHALRRTVAEKDGELAKARFELEKMQKHMEHLQTFSEKQMQRELEARMEELESNLRSEHQKRFDANQVHLTRELRELAGQIVELEAELQGLERQHEQDMRLVESTKKSQWSAQEKLSQKKKEWDTRETELKMSIVKADQKIISLEKEALVLYGKNLEMAQHLGELDP